MAAVSERGTNPATTIGAKGNGCMPLGTPQEWLVHAPSDVGIGAGTLSPIVYRGPMHAPAEPVATLRCVPDPTVAALAPRRRRGGRRPEGATARILREVILSRVIPELAGRHGPSRPGRPGSPDRGAPRRHARVEELARLLASGDSRGASALMAASLSGPGGLVSLMATLAEPAARRLGDFWAEDEIAELDVTLGLCCLRTAVRQTAMAAPPAAPAAQAPLVLSASQPGEPHALGPTFHAEAMWQAGWMPSVATPASEDALLERLARQRFDCLDLSLSAAFAQDERLPGVAETIARARRASRNPVLAVVVSGRATDAAGAGRLGADAAIPSALHVVGAVRRAMEARAA